MPQQQPLPQPSSPVAERLRAVEEALNILEDIVRPGLANLERRVGEFGSSIGALGKAIRETRQNQEPPKPSAQTLLTRVFACHVIAAIRNQPAVTVAAGLYP